MALAVKRSQMQENAAASTILQGVESESFFSPHLLSNTSTARTTRKMILNRKIK